MIKEIWKNSSLFPKIMFILAVLVCNILIPYNCYQLAQQGGVNYMLSMYNGSWFSLIGLFYIFPQLLYAGLVFVTGYVTYKIKNIDKKYGNAPKSS